MVTTVSSDHCYYYTSMKCVNVLSNCCQSHLEFNQFIVILCCFKMSDKRLKEKKTLIKF